jgi:hypothetical protein
MTISFNKQLIGYVNKMQHVAKEPGGMNDRKAL